MKKQQVFSKDDESKIAGLEAKLAKGEITYEEAALLVTLCIVFFCLMQVHISNLPHIESCGILGIYKGRSIQRIFEET